MAKDNLCLEQPVIEADFAPIEARILAQMTDMDLQRAAIYTLMQTAAQAPLIVGIDPAGPGDSVGFAISAPTNIPAKHLKKVKDAADKAKITITAVRPNTEFLGRMTPITSNASPGIEPLFGSKFMTPATKRRMAALIRDPYRGVVTGRMSHQMPNPGWDGNPLTLDVLEKAMKTMADINRPGRNGTIAEEHHARRGQVLGELSRELPSEMPRLQFGGEVRREDVVHPDVAQAFMWGPYGEWTGLIRPACLKSPFSDRGRQRDPDAIDLRDFTNSRSPGIPLKVFLVGRDGQLVQVDPSIPADYANDYLYDMNRTIGLRPGSILDKIRGIRPPMPREDPATVICFANLRGWKEWHTNIHDRGYSTW